MNAFSVSLMDETVRRIISSHRVVGSTLSRSWPFIYRLFVRYEDVCVSVCYIQVYNIIRPVIGIHLQIAFFLRSEFTKCNQSKQALNSVEAGSCLMQAESSTESFQRNFFLH